MMTEFEVALRAAFEKCLTDLVAGGEQAGVTVGLKPMPGLDPEGHSTIMVVMTGVICDCDAPACIYRGATEFCTALVDARLAEKADRARLQDDTVQHETIA